MLTNWNLDPFLSDPFFNDPFLSSNLFNTPMLTGARNTGGMQSDLGRQPGQQLMRRGGGGNQMMPSSSGLDEGWISFNNLLQEPLQLNLNEKDNEYELVATRPAGIRKKDLHLELNNNVLTISGERLRHRHRGGSESENYVSFSRSMTLPNNVDVNNIKASYDNQQNLHITLPKLAGSGPKQIQISGGQQQSSGSQLPEKQDQQSSMPMQTEKSTTNEMKTEPRAGTNIPISSGGRR
jgi:HSP20 family protein